MNFLARTRLAVCLLVAATVVLAVDVGLVIHIARGQTLAPNDFGQPDPADFWRGVKDSTLVGGAWKNCCGEGDGVAVEMLGEIETPNGNRIRARITDTLRSKVGRVGDVVLIDPRLAIIKLAGEPYFSPYPFAIAFLRKDGEAICLAGVGGG
jgi:hypothetical protein